MANTFIPTLSWVSENFDFYNKKYFLGKLSKPTFELKNLGKCQGKCSYNRNTSEYKIQLNSNSKRTLESTIDTLIHEMIHLKMYQLGNFSEGHGYRFKAEMNRINAIGGHHINVYYNVKDNDKTCQKTPIFIVEREYDKIVVKPCMTQLDSMKKILVADERNKSVKLVYSDSMMVSSLKKTSINARRFAYYHYNDIKKYIE